MAEVTPTERVSAETLIDNLTSSVLCDYKYGEPDDAASLAKSRAELLSRLSEVEELRKQVAALERNVADFDNSYFQDEGIAADGEIRKLTSKLRGRALAAEAEADRLRDTLESAKRTIDYEQEISTQLASRAETLSKRLREIIAIWYSRSQNKIVEMGDAVAKAESALSLPPSEEEPRP